MRIDVLTLFPEMVEPVFGVSILKRAADKGVVRLRAHDLRDWARNKHRTADDRPYGGGPGMVLKPEPFFEAVEDLKAAADKGKPARTTASGTEVGSAAPWVVLLSPQGKRLTQRELEALAARPWLILLCGHYEGVDERVREHLADEEISIGDYVLTCGELPAMVLVDGLVRLLPGALGDERSRAQESFCEALLEYPQYTRPAEYRGMRVPEVLLSGDAARIEEWRKLQALRRTHANRPDLFHESQDRGD